MTKTLPTNITDVNSMYSWVFSVEPLFFPVMLGAWWIIMFSVFSRFGASRGWTLASWVTFIPAVVIAIIGWMNPYWLYLYGVFLAAGVLWRSFESGEGN